MNEKVIFNWSGGKDSALSLHKLLQDGHHDILCLLTSINKKYQRISMHGVRVDLLEAQAKNMNLPLVKMELAEMPSMQDYENNMASILETLKGQGATTSVFGDIFLEDLREYREKQLAKLDLKALFPLWKTHTDKLIEEFIDLGFKTIVTCVNEKYLDKSFAGRVIDREFLEDLPKDVDPCGENGEFHTFVFDGPIFSKPVPFSIGETVYRKYDSPEGKEEKDSPYESGFWFCDLIPGSSSEMDTL